MHATNRVIACSFIYNSYLACGEGRRLDYCDVISAAGEPGMAIIMLDRLYFMLSCRVTLIDVAPVQHGRRAAMRPQVIQPGHTYIRSGLGSHLD
jgi:hypothetical protein